MRKKIIIASAALAVLFAAVGLVLYLITASIPKELLEYKSSDKWGAEAHAHISVYMTSGEGFDAYAMMRAKSELESAYTTDSIETDKALYSASYETDLTLTAVNSDRSSSCTATVYLEDFFKFHDIPLKEGTYPTDSAAVTNAVLVDEIAAWQLFGTGSGVTGMEVMIGDCYYVVSGVIKPLDGVYTDVYGEKPRVFLRADSAYIWTRQKSFTVFEAMIPDPITNYAKNAMTEEVSSYNAVVQSIDHRFGGESLDEMRDGAVKMITDSSDTEYPFFEKAMIILTMKAADVYAVMKVMLYISLAGVFVLFCAVYGPIVRFIEKIFKKIKF